MQFYFLHDRNWFHFIWTFHWIQVHLGVMLIIILENLLMCFLCYGHFIPYMPTSESLLSHDALCMCVFVHMPGCVFCVFEFLFHVRKLSQRRGKHIEGRCVNSSSATLPSSKESLCHSESAFDVRTFVFLGRAEHFTQ